MSEMAGKGGAGEAHSLSEKVRALREFTPARVGLRRAGSAVATDEVLAFQMDHAEARDAVLAELDVEELMRSLRESLGDQVPVMALRSAAVDRAAYLRRPDLGRMLDAESAGGLAGVGGDVVFVVGDGLSARAVQQNAGTVLRLVIPTLRQAGWMVAAVCVVRHARVAVGDEIGERMKSGMCVTLIGERPGLSAADSMGAYLTWAPRVGRTDAERNCISNIRSGGLPCDVAAARLLEYLQEARKRGLTGTALKDPGSSRELRQP